MSDDPKSTRLDARAVRVLAHPLRSRLLSTLRLAGPATATALAQTLDTNTGATSYHLRKLADVGLVEETAEGRGRERWWRAAHERHSWFGSDFAGDPDSAAASDWLQGESMRRFQERAESWQRAESAWPRRWREHAGTSDYFLDLSAEQLAALMAELDDVIERYRRTGPAGEPGGDAEARRVFLFLNAFPQGDPG